MTSSEPGTPQKYRASLFYNPTKNDLGGGSEIPKIFICVNNSANPVYVARLARYTNIIGFWIVAAIIAATVTLRFEIFCILSGILRARLFFI